MTRCAYNSFNQLTEQRTPDAGDSEYWYDRLDRLVISQNAEQFDQVPKEYSYTKYDPLGRIYEGGKVESATFTIDTYDNTPLVVDNWINSGTRGEVTRTVYSSQIGTKKGQTHRGTNLTFMWGINSV